MIRHHRAVSLPLAGCLLLAAACTADVPPWEGSVVREGEVVVVRNPDRPLLDSGAVRATLRWRADGADPGPDGAAPWAEPRELAIGSRDLYVLDPQATRVHVVSDDGRWLRSVGRQGGGPGEIERATSIEVIAGAGADTVVVLDGGKAALQLLDARGAPLVGHRLGAVAFDVLALDDGTLFVNALGGTGGRWLRYAPGDTAGTPVQLGGGAEGSCRRTSGGGGGLLRLDCLVPVVHELDPSGAVRRRSEVARDTARSTPAELDAFRARMTEMMGKSGVPVDVMRQMIDQQLEAARARPDFRDVRRDPATGVLGILEQTPEELGGGRATLHLLAPDGVYLARLPFAVSWTDFALRGGVLYALETDDETGLVSLAAYELTVPADALRRAEALARAP